MPHSQLSQVWASSSPLLLSLLFSLGHRWCLHSQPHSAALVAQHCQQLKPATFLPTVALRGTWSSWVRACSTVLASPGPAHHSPLPSAPTANILIPSLYLKGISIELMSNISHPVSQKEYIAGCMVPTEVKHWGGYPGPSRLVRGDGAGAAWALGALMVTLALALGSCWHVRHTPWTTVVIIARLQFQDSSSCQETLTCAPCPPGEITWEP